MPAWEEQTTPCSRCGGTGRRWDNGDKTDCECQIKSAQPCGCDPGCIVDTTTGTPYRCAEYPQCDFGKLKQPSPYSGDYSGGKAIEEAARAFIPVKVLADPKIGVGGAPTRATSLPTEPAERKKYPVATGVLDYFPDALVAVSRVSWQGNEQHNPGQPLHWNRSKSSDEDDTIIRHFLQRGTRDEDGTRHSAKMVWRALAFLQKEIEAERAIAQVETSKGSSTLAYEAGE